MSKWKLILCIIVVAIMYVTFMLFALIAIQNDAPKEKAPKKHAEDFIIPG